MLAEIYGWFTEGFDTADLKEAKVRRRIILKLALQEARNSKVGRYCVVSRPLERQIL